jgi:outer membrane protein TolC
MSANQPSHFNLNIYKNSKALLLIGVAFVLSLISSHSALALTLEEYSSEVLNRGANLKSAELMLKSATVEKELYKKYTSGLFYAEGTWMNDQRETNNPSFQGSETDFSGYTVGVKQNSPWGINWDLGYHVGHTQIYDASLTAVPVPDYYTVYPQLQVQVPLWKNFFGKQIRAQRDMSRYALEASELKSDSEYHLEKTKTNLTFYQLDARRKLHDINQDNLDRAQKLLSWSTNRKLKNLSEDSDYYQAKANLSLRQIDLQNSEYELAEASRQFNTLRGETGTFVKEKLHINSVDLNELTIPLEPYKQRKDILAQQKLAESELNEKIMNIEDTKPSLDLAVVTSLNGRDAEEAEASKEWKDDSSNYYAVSLQFKMPVDQFLMSRLRQGANQRIEAKKLKNNYLAKQLFVTWQDFVESSSRMKQQLTVLSELEEIQKKKVDTERIRFRQGRSTTFQVLNFEQDYINVRAKKIALELEARSMIEQKNLYVVAPK